MRHPGAIIITLFGLLNKVAGIYGMMAILSSSSVAGGLNLNAAQLSYYIYSVLFIAVFLWGLRNISQVNPFLLLLSVLILVLPTMLTTALFFRKKNVSSLRLLTCLHASIEPDRIFPTGILSSVEALRTFLHFGPSRFQHLHCAFQLTLVPLYAAQRCSAVLSSYSNDRGKWDGGGGGANAVGAKGMGE